MPGLALPLGGGRQALQCWVSNFLGISPAGHSPASRCTWAVLRTMHRWLSGCSETWDVQVTNCSMSSSPVLPAPANLRGSRSPGSVLAPETISALVSLHTQCLLPAPPQTENAPRGKDYLNRGLVNTLWRQLNVTSRMSDHHPESLDLFLQL